MLDKISLWVLQIAKHRLQSKLLLISMLVACSNKSSIHTQSPTKLKPLHDFHFCVELQEWSYLVPYLTVAASGRFNTGNSQDILINDLEEGVNKPTLIRHHHYFI